MRRIQKRSANHDRIYINLKALFLHYLISNTESNSLTEGDINKEQLTNAIGLVKANFIFNATGKSEISSIRLSQNEIGHIKLKSAFVDIHNKDLYFKPASVCRFPPLYEGLAEDLRQMQKSNDAQALKKKEQTKPVYPSEMAPTKESIEASNKKLAGVTTQYDPGRGIYFFTVPVENGNESKLQYDETNDIGIVGTRRT